MYFHDIHQTENYALPLNFHKANIYFLAPVSIVFSFIDLINRGVGLSTYGAELLNIAGIIACFTFIMFSIKSLYEFSKKQSNAFTSTMIARVTSFISCCIVSAETFDDYAMYGFDESVAILVSTISILCIAIITFLFYIYYEKRRSVLFDNSEQIS